MKLYIEEGNLYMDFNQNIFFDEYSFKARMCPALIAFFPLLFTIFLCYINLDSISWISSFLIIAWIILYAMSEIICNIGKKKEKSLVNKWGGMPTILFLRHSDNTIDKFTKERYYCYLEKNVPNLKLPDALEEQEDPLKADTIYQSAISWLKTYTRDKEKYYLIYESNVSYGFARNLWAIKYYGILICIISIGISLYKIFIKIGFKQSSYKEWMALIVSVSFILLWVKLKDSWVRLKADAYAISLLEVCDK